MRGRAIRAAWCALVLALAAGCGPGRMIDTVPGVASSCSGFASGGACNEQVEAAVARHPGATSVDLECTAAACDRRGGFGTAAVTMGDSSRRSDTFAYTGDRAPMPVPTCVGLAFDLCLEAARSQFDGSPPSKRVVSMAFTCTMAPCTAARAETDYLVTYADGTTDQGSIGWEGGPPGPQ